MQHIGQIIAFDSGCLCLTPLFGVNPWTLEWTAKFGLKKLETSL